MTLENPANKRKHVRVEEAVKVRFKFMHPPMTLSHIGLIDTVTRNISEGGVFMELNQQTKLKDDAATVFALLKCPIEIEIFLPDVMKPLKVEGKAVWVEKKVAGQEANYARGVAVQFTNINFHSQQEIRRFVSQFPPMG